MISPDVESASPGVASHFAVSWWRSPGTVANDWGWPLEMEQILGGLFYGELEERQLGRRIEALVCVVVLEFLQD